MTMRGEEFYRDVAANLGRLDRIANQPNANWAAVLIANYYDDGSRGIDDDPEHVVRVRIDRERYIADCPFCTSAQVAMETDLRFFCCDCLMDENGGLYVPTEWPT